MENKIQIKDVVCDPTSAGIVASNLHFDGSASNLKIEEITGTSKIDGKLTEGKLHISFSPFFDWGWGKGDKSKQVDQESLDDFKKNLRDVGLQESQIDQVIKLVDDGLNNIKGEANDIEYEEDSKKGLIGGESSVIEYVGSGVDFPLPDFPLSLDVDVDIKDTTIDSIGIKADTQLVAEDFKTEETDISEIDTIISLPFKIGEIKDIDVPSADVSKVDIANISTSVDISQINTSEIPLNLQTGSGSADITLDKLIDWHPRWKFSIGFKVLWKYIGIWVEFGLDLTVNIKYKLLINLLNISIKLSNAVFKRISFPVLKLVNTSAVNSKIGAIKIGKIIGK